MAVTNGNGSAARGVTLILTNLTKLGGLAVAINEAIFRTDVRPGVLAVSAFMMAGAQISEAVLLAVIDRTLGQKS